MIAENDEGSGVTVQPEMEEQPGPSGTPAAAACAPGSSDAGPSAPGGPGPSAPGGPERSARRRGRRGRGRRGRADPGK